MINIQEIFENTDVAKNVCLWLGDGGDSTDLAGAAECAAEMGVGIVSVMPSDVSVIWPWVEKLNVKIFPRFHVDAVSVNSLSGLGVDINSSFKSGADGAQIITHLGDLAKFTDSFVTVRDDLFFNKHLSVGFDVFEIWPLDWESVFSALRKLRASSLLLIMTHDMQEKSDFTGRVYAALQAWDAEPDMELHVMLNESMDRAEQVYRLISINRPELLNRVKFFVSY